MAGRTTNPNISGAANREPAAPHLLSMLVEDITKYSDRVSSVFDVANRNNASYNDYDEGFASGGSTGDPKFDQMTQDLSLRLRTYQAHAAEYKYIDFYGLQSISGELIREYATIPIIARPTPNVDGRLQCF